MGAASTITDILQTLLRHEKVITWKSRCCYADGAGNSLHEIHLYLRNGKSEKVLFQMENGKVLRCGNQHLSSTGSEDIVDLLLDLFSAENSI